MNEKDIIKILESEFAGVFTVVNASVNTVYPCYYVFFGTPKARSTVRSSQHADTP